MSKYSLDKWVAEQARARARAGHNVIVVLLSDNWRPCNNRVHKEISSVVESLSKDNKAVNENIIAVGLDGKLNELSSWHIRLFIGE
jgi:hypothetical protein